MLLNIKHEQEQFLTEVITPEKNTQVPTPEPEEPVAIPEPECCYRNCSNKAKHKIKNSNAKMSKFCDFHAGQQVTEMLVPV